MPILLISRLLFLAILNAISFVTVPVTTGFSIDTSGGCKLSLKHNDSWSSSSNGSYSQGRRRRHRSSLLLQSNHPLSVSSSSDDDATTSKPSSSSQQTTTTSRQKRRRKKINKYADCSNVERLEMDPLEQLVTESVEKNRKLQEERAAARQRQRRFAAAATFSHDNVEMTGLFPAPSSVLPKFPFAASAATGSETSMDPYDPSTFGYTKLGTILGAHGVHGWVKVQTFAYSDAALTDFVLVRPRRRHSTNVKKDGVSYSDGDNNSGDGGVWLHLKPANKRAPRPIWLLQGKPIMQTTRSSTTNSNSNSISPYYLLQFEGIDTRDDALRLRGATLYHVVQDGKGGKSDHDSNGEEGVNGPTEVATATSSANNNPQRNQQKEEYLVQDLVGLQVFLYGEDIKNQDDENDEKLQQKIVVGTVGGVVFGDDISDLPLGYDMLEIMVHPPPLSSSSSSPLSSPMERRTSSIRKNELVLIPLVPELVPLIDMERGAVYIDPPKGLLDLRYARPDKKVRIKAFLPPSSPS